MSISASISSSVVISHKPLYLGSSLQALSWNPVSKFSLSKRNDQISLRGNKNRSLVVYANVPLPSVPPPSAGSGKSWILAMIVSVIIPFFTHKWGPLGLLKNRIDNAVQMVEDIVETVEKVAGEVDKIAEDIAHDLPAGKLKDMVELIEDIAEKTAKTADSIDNVIDEAQEAEEKVECIVKSVVTSKKEITKVEAPLEITKVQGSSEITTYQGPSEITNVVQVQGTEEQVESIVESVVTSKKEITKDQEPLEIANVEGPLEITKVEEPSVSSPAQRSQEEGRIKSQKKAHKRKHKKN